MLRPGREPRLHRVAAAAVDEREREQLRKRGRDVLGPDVGAGRDAEGDHAAASARASASTRSSSALSTARPVGGSAATAFPFGATPSGPPSEERWSQPIVVTTPTSGSVNQTPWSIACSRHAWISSTQ